ncbi:MAG: hypothetical protein NC400_00975 [Clostridium sp.]|nr:hypothetical protein [Clostridium sp.]
MSDRERAVQLLNAMPDDKMAYVIGFIQGLTIVEETEIPNTETLEAIKEGDELLKNGTGQRFEGSTEDFFKMILEE